MSHKFWDLIGINFWDTLNPENSSHTGFLKSVPNYFLVFGENSVKEGFPKIFVQFIPNNSRNGGIG